MIIYNITTSINRNIEEEWLQWQKEEHIPEIMATNLFQKYTIYKLLHQDEDEEPTYIVQYFLDNIKDYNLYLAQHATIMREKAFNKWGNQFFAFRTLLEAVQ